MSQDSLKAKLRRGELTIGSWITLGHSSIAEIMVRAGFDWLTVDLEHSAITLAEMQRLVQVIELAGCPPLVRVGENDPNLIKRVMDTGAHGVIVPMVNSAKAAQAAVSAVRYPPAGTRGVGLARAQGYGASFEQYRKWLEKEGIVIVQIEHIDAVDHLEEILSVEGVDGLLVGPYDLSGSLGIPGDFEDPRVKRALVKIQEVAQKKKIAPGVHVIPPDPELLLAHVRGGFRFIAFSSDILLLGENCRSRLQAIRQGVSSKNSSRGVSLHA